MRGILYIAIEGIHVQEATQKVSFRGWGFSSVVELKRKEAQGPGFSPQLRKKRTKKKKKRKEKKKKESELAR